MRNIPDEIAKIKVGSILQANEEATGIGVGAFVVVDEKHSWGVVGYTIWDDSTIVRLPWNAIEPTGGEIVFDIDGKRVRETEPPLKHHS